MSEIRVDTISEKTSANGVAVDGVTLKDGAITSTAASTITTADNTDTLSLISTDADPGVGPNLRLYRNSSSPADNDYNGAVQWEWRNDNSQDVIGAEIQSYTRDVTDGTEDNILWFQNMTQGTLTEFLRFDTQSDQATITFNENSNDIDFRVESNGNANMLFVDGGNDHVNIGTSSDLGGTLNVQGAAVFSLTGNGDTLTLISTDEDAAQGPNLRLYRNSASPADNDVLGIIEFEGRNDNSQDFIAVQMESLVTDVSDGTEDAYLNISTMLAGSLRSRIEMDSGETVINEASQDLDFRVESNGVGHMLFVDGGNDRVGIAYSTPVSTLTVGGQITATAGAVSAPTYSFHSDTNTGMTRPTTDTLTLVTGGGEGLRVSQYAKLSTNGESASDTGEGGLCLNGAANDDFAMTFKNSDVSHGITGVAQADTYGALVKANSSNGGLGIYGFADSGTTGVELQAYFETNNTSKATNCNVPVKIVTRLRNGTSSTAPSNGSANSNLFGVADGTSTRFIVDSEGDLHGDNSTSITQYDTYEDAHLVRTLALTRGEAGKGFINSKFDEFVKYNHEDLADAGLVGREDDGTPNHFINITGMQRLHNGAIWQQYEKHQKLASAFYKLAEKTIGKEEADKLLTEEEIQLLN